MFGKLSKVALPLRWKTEASFNPRVRGTCLVSEERSARGRGVCGVVLIPVCGEHVW